MRPLLFLAIALPAVAADPKPAVLARLGDDRFRQVGRVEALAYSPDGQRLASAEDNAVLVWDAATGRRLCAIPLPKQSVQALAFAADGRTLYAFAAGERGMRLTRLDPATGNVRDDRRVLRSRGDGTFSPDGAWLALRDDDGERVHLIATAAGREVWTAVVADHRFCSCAFRPDGTAVAVGTYGGHVAVFDRATGKLLHDAKVAGGVLWNMAFSPDGKDLVAETSSPEASRVVRFDAATGAERWSKETKRAKDLAFAADGKTILYEGAGPHGHLPYLWYRLDAASGAAVGAPLDPGQTFAVARHPDGRTLAFGDFDGLIAQWDGPTGNRLAASADPPTTVIDLHFTAGATKVRGWARGWYEWDLATGRQTRLGLPPVVGPSVPVDGSRDLRWLAVARPGPNGNGFRVGLTDLAAGRSRPLPTAFPTEATFRFVPTGRLLVEAKQRLTVLDPAGRAAAVCLSFAEDYRATAVAADGATAVTFKADPARFGIDRWDLATGRLLGAWAGDVPDVKPLDQTTDWKAGLSRDGSVLAVRYTHVIARDLVNFETVVLDPRTGRKLGGWTSGDAPDLQFRPDGRAVLDWDRRSFGYAVREVATGGSRARVDFGRPVGDCCFHPDGRRLVVATGPHPVEVWDAHGPAAAWDPARADALWAALADPDAAVADPPIRQVRAHPADGVAFLKERVRVPEAIPDDWVDARLKALDARAFRDRERAKAELIAAGEQVAGRARAALPTASVEARERIAVVVQAVSGMTPERLRTIRACEALEAAGTPAALEVLRGWATGPADSTLTREATAGVRRMGR